MATVTLTFTRAFWGLEQRNREQIGVERRRQSMELVLFDWPHRGGGDGERLKIRTCAQNKALLSERFVKKDFSCAWLKNEFLKEKGALMFEEKFLRQEIRKNSPGTDSSVCRVNRECNGLWECFEAMSSGKGFGKV
ncbi:hypothetical protein CEXT_346361 [Caerostris extrusa]|uniref:Uncharacterized protein n=1 Tax=Caerostris extrusa TaxID=172846 RepID=A0AAV4W952_CAEEX|nr:hypothetical protein CEXT_346361 [Caerostris extrusa]